MEAVSLRPIREEDMDFLLRLYATTRADEMAMVTDWSDEQKEWFVRMQFQAQHAWYQEHYGDAQFDVILLEGVPAGRLYVHRRAAEIRLIDISLMPELRGRGIGSILLRELMGEAEAAGKPLTIHVEKYNPAMRLYLRLGFKPIEDRGPYDLMEWRPEFRSRSEEIRTGPENL
ncbi:MAG TPA: GNAT family N-acetyltransferase [Thermoanaerobaculia bacterium]|nr:GNAT family N-acetyltransferase [Thermoanaerobaculia bacterium]